MSLVCGIVVSGNSAMSFCSEIWSSAELNNLYVLCLVLCLLKCYDYLPTYLNRYNMSSYTVMKPFRLTDHVDQ